MGEIQVSSRRITSLRLLLEYNRFTHPRAELTVTPTQVLLEIIEYTITALQSYTLLL